jgi:hypothetical protein
MVGQLYAARNQRGTGSTDLRGNLLGRPKGISFAIYSDAGEPIRILDCNARQRPDIGASGAKAPAHINQIAMEQAKT